MNLSFADTAEIRRRLRHAREAVDAVINADAFDVAATDAMAHRSTYADAASALLRIIDCPGRGLVRALLKAETFAPYRLGLVFGAIPHEANIMQPVTIDDLTALNTPEARLAAIAVGGDYDWKALDRRSRAVLVLRRLVRTMMGVVSYDTK